VYRVAVMLERVRLPAAAIEREHELRAKSFAERVVYDETLQLRNELGCPAECQVCLHALFERLQSQLFEPRRLGLRERVVDEVCERGVAPKRERVGQQLRSTRGIGGCVRCGERVFEAGRVELLRLDAQDVSWRARYERIRPERAAQPRDVDLDVVARGSWPIVRPELLDQPVDRDDLVPTQQEYSKQSALLRRSERERAAVPGRLEGAEDPELERRDHVETPQRV
jgi:hypothetical protein